MRRVTFNARFNENCPFLDGRPHRKQHFRERADNIYMQGARASTVRDGVAAGLRLARDDQEVTAVRRVTRIRRAPDEVDFEAPERLEVNAPSSPVSRRR